MLRKLALAFMLFLPISMLVGYATSPATIIPTEQFRREVGTIRVCASPKLVQDTEKAVGEWNAAIAFFSVRFGWLELLGLRLEVAETGCDAHVVLAKTPESINAMTLPAEDDGGSRIVFIVTVSNTLPPEKRIGVIVHELAHVLGLLDGFSLNAPFKPATDISGRGRVTSHDVYALYAKMKGADGAYITVPPYIPYMTAEMPVPDIASAIISFLAAFTLDRMLRRRGKA